MARRPTSAHLPVGLRVLAIVQAGGRGSRMDVLTQRRAKPSLTFAGTHALVDFPLSCLAASSVRDVWVSVQYLPGSLDAHLAGGRPWDLDRTVGGFRRVVPGEEPGEPDEDGFSHGNADLLYRIRDEIVDNDPDVVVVLSADHIFALDLDEVVADHLAHDAECTLVTSEVGVQEARHKMVVTVDADGVVTGVADKPSDPASTTVATEIFLYRTDVLVEVLEQLRERLRAFDEDETDEDATADEGDTGLEDFGTHLVPQLVRRGRTRAWRLPGYWRDVGRVQAYLQAHRDLLAGRIDAFAHPLYSVRGANLAGAPAHVDAGGEVVESMLAPGSRVRGRVVRSVLGRGVEVAPGAEVVDSVLLDDVVVEAGARVHTAILDARSHVGREARVGEPPAGTRLSDEAIVVVGQQARVGAGAVVAPGARIDPDARA